MDYIGNKCPVCEKRFHADDDIVVCPECGTPHHRECWEQLGHCCNEGLHAQGYDYNEDRKKEASDIKKCPSCGRENDSESFFCRFCGTPLSSDGAQPHQNNTQNQNTTQGFPFGMGFGSADGEVPFIDPLGGVPGDTDLGDGVTAGEAAKYVKQNTPYFIRVFSNIRNFNKSKFNFSAGLFTSGYLLYRKLYKVGAALFALQLGLFAVILYFSIAYRSLYEQFSNSVYSNAMNYTDMINNYTKFIEGASATDMLLLYLPAVILLVYVALKLVAAFCFNRLYFNYCRNQIKRIKAECGEGENPETLLQTKGGVNTALASSVIGTAMIIYIFTNVLII